MYYDCLYHTLCLNSDFGWRIKLLGLVYVCAYECSVFLPCGVSFLESSCFMIQFGKLKRKHARLSWFEEKVMLY